MTIKSNFSNTGLDIGSNDNNMTYLYGLSDFFSVMFEDTSTINLLLEAETEVASEIYSRFLQFTSSLSLQNIQDTTNSSLKLVLLSSSDKVSGEINTYKLSEKIQTSKYIANRAFLPTELLDELVDYSITQKENGECYIKFAKPISEYAFPVRLLSDGVTEQRAIWFVDVEIDENLLSKFYGDLIGVTSGNASARFSDFVYGLFYVYTHGPKLDTLSRGLNLALGIPVARAEETVLSIRNYLETDQYIVVCDQNQYLIPYGLTPTVLEGDTLVVGQTLAQWVEIKDYESDGDWWINLHIPEKLVPEVPKGQKDRYATKGSHYDYLMRNYLKTHTFLVKVKVDNFKNIQEFIQLSDLIKKAKPCYTEAIYVWSLENTETLSPTEKLTTGYFSSWDDSIHPCISRLRRSNTDDPIIRGNRTFIRYNVDPSVTEICGTDNYVSKYNINLGYDLISGYVNPTSQFRDNTGPERGWIKSILNRGHSCYHVPRDKVGFTRGATDPLVVDGTPYREDYSIWGVDDTMDMVPLYTTTVEEMTSRMQLVGLQTPQYYNWWFEIFSARSYTQAINDLAVNYLPPNYDPLALVQHYTLFFNRTETYLGREFGDNSKVTWIPDISNIKSGDYLLCIKITNTVVGVYWITSNREITLPPYFPVGEIDPIAISCTSPIGRGMGILGAPMYVLRGAGDVDSGNSSSAIDDTAINEQQGGDVNSVVLTYRDANNPNTIVWDRSNISIKHTVRSSPLTSLP